MDGGFPSGEPLLYMSGRTRLEFRARIPIGIIGVERQRRSWRIYSFVDILSDSATRVPYRKSEKYLQG